MVAIIIFFTQEFKIALALAEYNYINVSFEKTGAIFGKCKFRNKRLLQISHLKTPYLPKRTLPSATIADTPPPPIPNPGRGTSARKRCDKTRDSVVELLQRSRTRAAAWLLCTKDPKAKTAYYTACIV
jgi:hypothetical protein